MNQQQKEQWLAALRSGEYQQGKGVLKDYDGGHYCCLGVAAEVCHIESTTAAYIKCGALFVFLPEKIQIHLGDTNDSGKSFAEIADYIEQHVQPTE